MDSFFILELVDPSKLGVFYPDDNDKKIAIIKALVTKNEQVYPRAYLSSPDFILYLDEEGPFDQL